MNAYLNETINRFLQIFPIMVPQLANKEIAVTGSNNYMAEFAFKISQQLSYKDILSKLKNEADFVMLASGSIKENSMSNFQVSILLSRPQPNYLNIVKVVTEDGVNISQMFVSVYTSVEVMSNELKKIVDTFPQNFKQTFLIDKDFLDRLLIMI